MKRRGIKVYDSSRTLYVTRDCVIDNIEYKENQELDKSNLSNNMLDNLIRYGWITDRKPFNAVTPDAPVEPLPVPPPAPEPTSGVEVRHNGGGYYSIWENGICLSEGETIKGEKAAKKWLTDNL